MTSAESQLLLEREATEVLDWRLTQLERSGYDRDVAVVLAMDTQVDLHQAVELLGRGCPLQLALEILL